MGLNNFAECDIISHPAGWQKGDDFIGFLFFCKGLKGFAKLAYTPKGSPVVVVVGRKNAESADNGRVYLYNKVDFVNLVLLKHKAAYFFLLLVAWGSNAVDFNLKNLFRRILVRNENIVIMLHQDFLLSATVLSVRRINSS